MRVNRDIRLIVHRTEASLLLCYVDHHDKAYAWAERRKLEVHPKTGAAQIVEVRERIEEIAVPKYITVEQPEPPKPLLFSECSDDELLDYGVPQEWLEDVRKSNEDSLLELTDHLPAEAAEALLELATGGTPERPQVATQGSDPFAHPDAQRRFRVMADVEELERALDYPWEKWTVFLHPAQRELVERDHKGPARVSGSAGTGKTIVALHRAVYLARHNPDARVLLSTFSDTLANALHGKLRRLISNQPRLAERLEVHSMDAIGLRLYERYFGKPRLAGRDQLRELLLEAAGQTKTNKFSPHFLLSEWEQVVDAWQLRTWEAYRDIKRLGRKTRLPEQQRKLLWAIFEQVIASLEREGLTTKAAIFTRLAGRLQENRHPPFEFAVVDEAQDISVPQLRFLASLGGDRPNALYFAGDLGQRIFQQPFSWKSLGVDVRGRSRTLRINYRTSHQIRSQADRLLGEVVADVDGNEESRKGTISVFNGPRPQVLSADSSREEANAVAEWLKEVTADGIASHEIGVFVRSEEELGRARAALENSGLPYKVLDAELNTTHGYVSVSTMHLAKGLEFRAVAVTACDDEVIPSQERIEQVTDESDLEEVYETERHLLYVACTRARDRLLITSGDCPSEFLDDFDS